MSFNHDVLFILLYSTPWVVLKCLTNKVGLDWIGFLFILLSEGPV